MALPIAAISIVTPVVLTSCGSSNTNNGGTSGDTTKPESYISPWKSSSSIAGLTIANNRATITLDSTMFDETTISKASKYVDIVNSLSPNTSSTNLSEVTKDGTSSTPSTDSPKTLYTVLSSLINNVDKFTVQLSIKPNPISFDFSNDKIGNTFSGQFVLTPIADKNSASGTTSLDFTINNFNDSNNDSNKLTWNVDAIAAALKSDQTTGNHLQEITPKNNGAAAVIDLSNPGSGQTKPTLSQVMNELSSTTISKDEIKKFITNGDSENYNLDNAIISTWTPTVDYSMVITRIVVPNKDNSNSAIMYLDYTGYTIDQGNGAWNRNVTYVDANDLSGDLWDKEFNEPVIDLSKVNGNIGETGISKIQHLNKF